MTVLQDIIETAFEDRANLTPATVDTHVKKAVDEVINMLDSGKARVAEPTENGWQVNEWLKKAVLLSFKINANQSISGEFTQFYDKAPLKYQNHTVEDFNRERVRVVPPATIRQGAYVAPNTVLMPSYVNIGAYVDTGCMIDTWATVGSCAQIGKNVHISGGAGIGGVLEPLQATPTIIEDNCFIGARSEIVEGVIVGKNAVISMGVFIGQSTKIYHRETGEVFLGYVPEGSVVVPGTLPAKDGSHALYAAIIIKQIDEKTRSKISLNELLRDAE
ncbi:MAG: 2,3,4,5-tetrahydropyridine-2,6-dicarboxylate N-succinyltransferase [Legionellales bacterium]|nr:2,3,4,5-tetrahydropyridine-2,6-dicarboxylate N-succinyltransferase [Legionellales bacterium]